eukprot:PITA_11986
MKKSKDAKAWFLGMRKFLRLHEYLENMKSKVATFNIKGKENIWWEDVKNVKDIHEEVLTWSEFERIFRMKYISERYYDDKVKKFYELKMGSMIDYEYTSRFLELLRSLEEAIQKLKCCYEQLKRRSETKPDWKGNERNKGKWDKRQERPQDIGNKENAMPHKKFNSSNRRQEFQYEEQNKGAGWKPLQCWTCGKDHHRRDFPQHKGGRP